MSSSFNNSFTVPEVGQQLRICNSLPADLTDVFAEEADEHLRTIYQGMDCLKINAGDQSALGDVRRASHTLKGAAGAVGMMAVTHLAHRMEDLLDRLAEQTDLVETDRVAAGRLVSITQQELLLDTADQLQALTSDEIQIEEVAKQIVAIYDRYQTEMEDNHACEPIANNSVDIQDKQVQRRIRPRSAGKKQQFLRVPMDRLDELVALLGEMTVNRSKFQQQLDYFESRIEDLQNAMGRMGEVAQLVKNKNELHSTKTELSVSQSHQNFASAASTEQFDGFDELEFQQFNDNVVLEDRLDEANKDAEVLAGDFRKAKSGFDVLLRRQQQLNRDAQKKHDENPHGAAWQCGKSIGSNGKNRFKEAWQASRFRNHWSRNRN